MKPTKVAPASTARLPPAGAKGFFVARTPGNFQTWDVWEVSSDGKELTGRIVRHAELHQDAVRIEQRLRINYNIEQIEGSA